MSDSKNNICAFDSEPGIHGGHRERMREKFKTYGERVFATYELIEMLLYYVIPYKDTNPVSRRLMKRFLTPDGIARAERAELLEVDGIGERTADFIFNIFEIYKRINEGGILFAGEKKITKTAAGDFFVNYFSFADSDGGALRQRTVAVMLDSDMRMLALTEPYGLDFGSGAVQSRPFIDAAMATHATNVIIAHNHPYGPLFPSRSDMVSNALIESELAAAGISLLEHYVVCGGEYISIMNTDGRLRLNQGDARQGKETGVFYYLEDGSGTEEEKRAIIADILSLVLSRDTAEQTASELLCRFMRICDIFYADAYVLKEIIDSEAAVYFLKLFFALFVRQRVSRFTFGAPHSEREIAEYFINLIGYEPIEQVYIMLFDARGRAKSCEFVSEGTVDTSNLPPRRILEIAKRHEAAAVALVHNHPSSGVSPSRDDIAATVSVKRLFESVGISFLSHYIVSCNDFCIIGGDTVKYKKDFEN